jgi:hypothetical protein
MADIRPEPWRPMETAPVDGTIVRLLVDYSGDGCHPLEDADVAQTIGGNTDGNTGTSEGWKFAGWSWEQDCFTEGCGKPIGWLPFAHLDLTHETDVQRGVAVLRNVIDSLRANARFVDEEGEDTNALEELLRHVGGAPGRDGETFPGQPLTSPKDDQAR